MLRSYAIDGYFTLEIRYAAAYYCTLCLQERERALVTRQKMIDGALRARRARSERRAQLVVPLRHHAYTLCYAPVVSLFALMMLCYASDPTPRHAGAPCCCRGAHDDTHANIDDACCYDNARR